MEESKDKRPAAAPTPKVSDQTSKLEPDAESAFIRAIEARRKLLNPAAFTKRKPKADK